MTDEQLDELERLEREGENICLHYRVQPLVARLVQDLREASAKIARLREENTRLAAERWEALAVLDTLGIHLDDGDGDYAARNALPALIAEVRRLRAMVGEDAPAVAPEDVATEAALDAAGVLQ